ncbi:MAG: hypothetical protein IPM46_16235 [Flavobacteriales bacterium]|nr:hypothetical protein [Flavobacteriales bacterium]
MHRSLALFILIVTALCADAQQRGRLPDVSSTVKGDLVLPVPLRNPLFNSITETVGQVGLTFQLPVYKGLGLGLGSNMTWFTLKERALNPFIVSGDVRRLVAYGKVQYEQYTGERTFYELSLRIGLAGYDFDCSTCVGQRDPVLYWSLQTGYYVHATDNLAFGLLVGYDNQRARFSAADLGLENFPGRTETTEAGSYQNLIFGLGFSTRLRRSDREAVTW